MKRSLVILSRTIVLLAIGGAIIRPLWGLAQTTGGIGTPSNPLLVSGSSDITSYILANTSIRLGGGAYTVAIPSSGVGVSPAGNGAAVVSGDGNLAATTPVVSYTGVISGTGQINVTNVTSTTQPSLYAKFSGGALVISNAQTFTNPAGPIFSVAANTVLSINGGSIAPSQSLANNGEIYANKDGYVFTKITGTGYISLENNSSNEAHLSGINTISGAAINLYGEYIDAGTILPENLPIISTDINVIKNGGGRANSIFDSYVPAANTIIGGAYYADGPDTQLQGAGVTQFNGPSFIIVRNPAVVGVTGIYPASEAEKYSYFYNISDQKGRVFYITQGTMMLGDGRVVVNNSDCPTAVTNCINTNNTFAQGNPYQQNLVIETGQFDYTPITTLQQSQAVQTIALNYSGVYTFNAGVNFGAGNVDASAVGGANVTDGSGNIGPTRQDVSATIVNGEDYGNFVLVNPGDGRAANHAIVTEPIYAQGVTQVQPNTILQLGDGTAGTPYGAKGTATTNGVTGVYDFSSSGGNGMLVTAGNALPIFQNAAFYQIQDNGQIIVDNVIDARDLVNASTAANAFMRANELDGITGKGSVEQRGTLPLTLGAPTGNTNSYTGGTTIASGATLIAGSETAFGAHDPAVGATSGGVVNHGTLQAGGGVRTIVVSGDYTQSSAGATAQVDRAAFPADGAMTLAIVAGVGYRRRRARETLTQRCPIPWD